VKYYIILLSILVISVIGVNDVFGINAGPEYTPTQPNALASYDDINNQITVTWNFDSLPVDTTTCLLKGDFVWQEDLNRNYNVTPAQNELNKVFDKSTSFIPLQYAVVSPTPTTINATTIYTEVIPCTNGEMRIDIDTIMSDSLNINNYKDLQIFLTFYVPNSNGGFSASSSFRIDEVFVFYTPDDIWSNNAKTWACGNQIGSVLYIDQSGIHGSNGDNCDKYLVLDPFQWVEIQMYGSSNPTPKGTPSYDFHDGLSQLLFKVGLEPTQQQEQNKKNGGGGCSDCEPPTLGLNKAGKRQVDNGITINGNSTNVEYWHTPTDKIIMNIGEEQEIKFKVYENGGLHNLWRSQLAIGIKEIGTSLNEAEAIITTTMHQHDIESVKIEDKNNLFVVNATTVTTKEVTCKNTQTKLNCTEFTIKFTFAERPNYDVFRIDVADNNHNNSANFFNDGIEVHGETLNEQPTSKVYNRYSSTIKDGLFINLIRTDKVTDMWIDDKNRVWHYLGNDRFEKLTPEPPYVCDDKPLDEIMNGGTRINCNYNEYIDLQAKKALEKMAEICPDCLLPTHNDMKESFSRDITPRINDILNDPEMILRMEAEAQRALEYLQNHRQ